MKTPTIDSIIVRRIFFCFMFLFASCGTNNSDCIRFKNGKFLEVLGDTLHIVIDRKDDKQTETSELGKSKYKITWVSDCEYESQLLETDVEISKENIGMKYTILITSVEEDGYSFECTREGRDFTSKESVKVMK